MIRTQPLRPRGLIATVVFVVAAALSVSLIAIAVGVREADAGSRYRVVTKTFTNSSWIDINDATSSGPTAAAPYPSKIYVSGFRKGRIIDVNLKLQGLMHDYPGDVDILLVGPRGQNAKVMSDVVNNLVPLSHEYITLDDEASRKLPEYADVLPWGRYKPTNYNWGNDAFPDPAPTPSGKVALSTFDGTNPSGRWKLYVVDDSAGPSAYGEIYPGWTLQIKAKVPR